MGYRIKTISELTGIPKSTLLAWERRYNLVTPERADNGYREYTEADLTLLRELKRLIDQGYKVSEAISLLVAPTPAPPLPLPAPSAAHPPDELRGALFSALMSFDRMAAVEIMEGMALWSYPQLIDNIFFPMLRDIGQGWSEGHISVVQEHFASDFVKRQMSSMLLRLGCGPQDGPLAICAGYPGENHELGLLGLSIKLALRGWRVTHLGPNVPLADLAPLLRSQRPAMLCVSVQQLTDAEELSEFAAQLASAAPPKTRVVVGGSGLPQPLTELEGVEWARSTHQLFGHNGTEALH